MGEECVITLTQEEHLIGVALALIGIPLSQECIIRVSKLVKLTKEKDIKEITISDANDIVRLSEEEYKKRIIEKTQ